MANRSEELKSLIRELVGSVQRDEEIRAREIQEERRQNQEVIDCLQRKEIEWEDKWNAERTEKENVQNRCESLKLDNDELLEDVDKWYGSYNRAMIENDQLRGELMRIKAKQSANPGQILEIPVSARNPGFRGMFEFYPIPIEDNQAEEQQLVGAGTRTLPTSLNSQGKDQSPTRANKKPADCSDCDLPKKQPKLSLFISTNVGQASPPPSKLLKWSTSFEDSSKEKSCHQGMDMDDEQMMANTQQMIYACTLENPGQRQQQFTEFETHQQQGNDDSAGHPLGTAVHQQQQNGYGEPLVGGMEKPAMFGAANGHNHRLEKLKAKQFSPPATGNGSDDSKTAEAAMEEEGQEIGEEIGDDALLAMFEAFQQFVHNSMPALLFGTPVQTIVDCWLRSDDVSHHLGQGQRQDNNGMDNRNDETTIGSIRSELVEIAEHILAMSKEQHQEEG